MKNYLSGSITKDPNYIEKFERFAKLVPGHVNNPIHFKPFLGIKIWAAYMITCLRAVIKSDALYLIPDWKYSIGAKIEFWLARVLGKPCYQINPTPQKREGIKIVEHSERWAVYYRQPITGRYTLVRFAQKFQKLC